MMTTRLLPLFSTAFLIGADEFLLGPILTPIGADLGVDPGRVVLLVAAYGLPLALLAPFMGALSDRLGRPAVLVPASALFAAASIATGLAPDLETALLFRLLTGVASAGMLPVAFAMAAEQEEAGAARGIALVQTGLTPGIIVGPAMGAAMAGLVTWRGAFFVLGALAALVAAGSLLAARGLPRPPAPAPRATRAPLLVPGAAGALLAMALGLGGAVGLFSLLGERLRELYGLDTAALGAVYVAFGLATVAGNLLMPPALRRIGSGRRVMRLALACILVAICLVWGLDTLPSWVAALAVATWAVTGGAGAPALQTHLFGLSPHRRGTLMALGSSALNLGVAVSSALAGSLEPRGSSWLVVLAAALLLPAMLALRAEGGSGRRPAPGPRTRGRAAIPAAPRSPGSF